MLDGMSVQWTQSKDQGEGPFRKSPLRRSWPSVPHGTNFFRFTLELHRFPSVLWQQMPLRISVYSSYLHVLLFAPCVWAFSV